MRIATAEQMRTLDRRAIEERGVPSLELMERAANALAEAAIDTAANAPGRAVCFCGPGNNGGDGVACARLLLEAGFEVRCILVGQREKLNCDTRAMEARLAAAGGVLEPFTPDDPDFAAWCLKADVMVDAIFGIGLNTEVRGDALTAVHMMNTCDIPVVSADIPSGVEADTGRVLGEAVRAARTVTFTLPKAGHYVGKGGLCTGVLTVADIGIPRDLVDGEDYPVQTVEGADVRLPVRPRDAHKGDFGKVFILGGSEGYTGAPVLAACGALRTGAGLVYVGVPREIYPIVAVKCQEAMAFPLPEEYDKLLEKARSCDVAVIGPGLGRHPRMERLVRSLLCDLEIPVVLDADGINALSGHIDSLDRRRAATVLTPHAGEFVRLTGCALPIQDRVTAARTFAKDHRCTLVLKGRGTVTAAPDGHTWLNGTGNPGMAKGGSGDVLAGMIAALLGQKHLQGPHATVSETTALAVWLHGKAGDKCAQRFGEYAMLPSDLIGMLPEVLKENEERK